MMEKELSLIESLESQIKSQQNLKRKAHLKNSHCQGISDYVNDIPYIKNHI